jgi:hypothetical protein
MAVAFRSVTSGTDPGAGNPTPSAPSGIQADDILLAVLNCEDNATATVTPATGWVQVTNLFSEGTGSGQQLMSGVYWLRYNGSNYTSNWTISAGGAARFASVAAYSGCKTTGDPWNGTPVQTLGSDTSAEAGSITTTVNGCMFVALETVFSWNGAVTGTAGWDERLDQSGSGPANIYDQLDGNAGVSPALTISGDGNWVVNLLALEPASPPADVDEPPSLVEAGALQAEASTTTLGPMVIPASAQADDIMILTVMLNAAGTFSTPSESGGWTQFGTEINSANQSTNWFWKRHTGSETNPNTTTSVTMSTTIGGYGRVYVFRGCITTGDPFEDVTMAGTPTSSTTPTTAAIDTTGDNELAVSFLMVDDDNTWSSGNPPALWDICGARVSSTTGGDAMFDAISRPMTSAGNVAQVTIGTQSAADYWRTLTLALIPEPVGGGSVTGTGATTNADDTTAGSGTETITGTGTTTNANDSTAGSGAETFTGTGATTNADDTSTGTAVETFTGTGTTTNADDSTNAAGIETITGTGATTNADDSTAAAGLVANPVTGTGATTNADDTTAGAGVETFTGSGATTNADDATAGTAVETFTGTGATTNADDSTTASGLETITGTNTTTNADDSTAGDGTVTLSGVTGTGATTNADDTTTASGVETFTGSGATINLDDASTATAVLMFAGAGATTNADDTTVGSGVETISGAGGTTNGNDATAGAGLLTITGISITTNLDDTTTGSGTASATVTGTGATTNADDVNVGIGNTPSTGTRPWGQRKIIGIRFR